MSLSYFFLKDSVFIKRIISMPTSFLMIFNELQSFGTQPSRLCLNWVPTFTKINARTINSFAVIKVADRRIGTSKYSTRATLNYNFSSFLRNLKKLVWNLRFFFRSWKVSSCFKRVLQTTLFRRGPRDFCWNILNLLGWQWFPEKWDF